MRVGVLVFPGADELDVVGPYRVFAALPEVDPGGGPVELLLVAEHDGPVRLDKGIEVRPHATFETCPPLDVLVVPGGGSRSEVGRRQAQAHEPTLAFVRRAAGGAEVTVSVCTGAFVLAGAGLLAGRRANTHWTARDELRAFMAERGEDFELVAERVVDDGDVVTGGGVTSGIDIAYHLVERFRGPEARKWVEAAIEAETPP